MLKTLHMELIRSLAGFAGEIIAVFRIKKSQIDSEMTTPKIFKLFTHFSSNFWQTS